MANKPDVKPPVPSDMADISISASSHAPFLYFDEAPTFGHLNGVIQVTLEALRLYPGNPGVMRERVAVAHLRMNKNAARHLIGALEGALLLAEPVESETKN